MKQETNNIVYADASMIPELTELWMEAFGDERAYVEFYFANRFTKDNLLVRLKEGRPVSMISLLPVLLHRGGEKIPARYVYAVATLPDDRGRGYARELILWAKEHLKVPLLLEPAGEELAEYYRRMGFSDACFVREYDLMEERKELIGAQGNIDLAAAEIPFGSAVVRQIQRYWLLTITPSEYAVLRNAHFAGEGYVEWDREAIAYALLENEFQGGYAYKVFHEGREDILLYRMEEEKMEIIETTLTDEDILGVVEKLKIHPKEIRVRRPLKIHRSGNQDNGQKHLPEAETFRDVWEMSRGKQRVLGMLLWEEEISEGYLNLTLE